MFKEGNYQTECEGLDKGNRALRLTSTSVIWRNLDRSNLVSTERRVTISNQIPGSKERIVMVHR
jgi:hypothetical protein